MSELVLRKNKCFSTNYCLQHHTCTQIRPVHQIFASVPKEPVNTILIATSKYELLFLSRICYLTRIERHHKEIGCQQYLSKWSMVFSYMKRKPILQIGVCHWKVSAVFEPGSGNFQEQLVCWPWSSKWSGGLSGAQTDKVLPCRWDIKKKKKSCIKTSNVVLKGTASQCGEAGVQ